MRVEVGKAGSSIQRVTLDDGATVEDALDEAGFSIGSSEKVKIISKADGESRVAELDSELQDNDLVLVIPEVKGGFR